MPPNQQQEQQQLLLIKGFRMQYAILSGFCAALASLFGKLISTETMTKLLNGTRYEEFQFAYAFPAIFVILMLLSNAMVWTFFVKALHSKNGGGTLAATVTSAASNYCISAFLGCVILGETTSLLWWTGISLVIMGLILIVTTNDDDQMNKKK